MRGPPPEQYASFPFASFGPQFPTQSSRHKHCSMAGQHVSLPGTAAVAQRTAIGGAGGGDGGGDGGWQDASSLKDHSTVAAP